MAAYSITRFALKLHCCNTSCKLYLKCPSVQFQRGLCSGSTEPPIPTYYFNPNESTELKRSRLLYQSRKRGMLENGLLLGTFASKYLQQFSNDELHQYDILINLPSNDWDIYYWVTGLKETPEEYNSDVMKLLKKHCQNESKESRYTQPDLY